MNSGCSSRHATHQDAKTLTSETSPSRSALASPSVRPWTGGRANSGTGLPMSADGSSRGSRVNPQPRTTPNARKKTTGTKNTGRTRADDRFACIAVIEASVIVFPASLVDEQVFNEGRSRGQQKADHQQDEQANSPHPAAPPHPSHHSQAR